MYLKYNHKKIEIKTYDTFSNRFRSLKFYLEPLQFGLYFPKKKYFSTTFFCQRVDLYFLNQDQVVLYSHSNVRSEKRFLHFKAKSVLVLPVGSSSFFSVGDHISFQK